MDSKDYNIYNIYFYIGMMLLTFKAMADSSELIQFSEMADNILNGLIIVSFMLKFFEQKFLIKDLFLFGIIGLCCLYTSVKMNFYYLIFTFMAIITFEGVDIKKVLKYRLYVSVTMIAFHVLYFLYNYWIDPSKITVVVRNGVERYSIYMGHPNTFSMYLLWSTLEIFYLLYDKISFRHIALGWLINWCAYQLADSNTSIMVITVTSILILLQKRGIPLVKKGIYLFAKYGFGLMTALFLGITATYSMVGNSIQQIYMILDKLFTGRILMDVYMYQNFGITLLGQEIPFGEKIEWQGHWFDTIYLDNAYMWLLLSYGALYAVVLIIMIFWSVKYLTEKEYLFFVAYIVYGVMEAYVINVGTCFPLLFLAMAIFGEKRKSQMKDKIGGVKENGMQDQYYPSSI